MTGRVTVSRAVASGPRISLDLEPSGRQELVLTDILAADCPSRRLDLRRCAVLHQLRPGERREWRERNPWTPRLHPRRLHGRE